MKLIDCWSQWSKMPSDTPDANQKAKFAHVVQAWLARVLLFVVRLFPVHVTSGFGGWLGRTIGPFLPVTKMARRNISRSFPKKSSRDIDQIIEGMWDNFGRVVFEFPNLDKIRFSGPDPHIEYVNPHEIANARDDGEPGVFVAGHLANWELAVRSIGHKGLPLHTIFRAFNNPLIHDLPLHRNFGDGELIPKGSKGAKRLIQLLKNGEHIGMLPDQKLNEGIAIPFFGRDAMTPPALAQFALRFDCPVIPVRIERKSGVNFRITYYPPMKVENTGDRHADVRNFMIKINGMLEGWISERPDQWLWLHRRWPEN